MRTPVARSRSARPDSPVSADIYRPGHPLTAPGFGVSESGAEFGESNIPGTLGTDYTWPDTAKIQTLRSAGMNIFRVPFLMERLVPDNMTGTPDSTYLQGLKKVQTYRHCSCRRRC